jgi:pyridoxal phosphate enzyme (YggS family)
VSEITDNIAKVQARIQLAAKENDRNIDQILLLAASKTRSTTEILDAYNAGIHDFGENYVKEAEEKILALQDRDICWHFIGPIQSNKTRPLAEHFHWVHSVDRIKVARRLQDQRPENLPPLNICIQINIDHEASKSGIQAPALSGLVEEILTLDRLKLRGLMVIPDPGHSPDQLQLSFRKTRELLEQANDQFPGLAMDTLSMGMTEDLELAIAEGSTMVRVGTAIFGPRS